MTMRSARWKRDASSRIFSQAVTSAGVIGSPETPLYFAFIVSALNSGSHSCQTSSVSTTMSSGRLQCSLDFREFFCRVDLDVFDLEHLLSYDRVAHGDLHSNHRHQREGRQDY